MTTLWTPAQLGSNMLIWVDPTNPANVTLSGSNLASIVNSGSLGGTFSAASSQPLKATINGQGAYGGGSSPNASMVTATSLSTPASDMTFIGLVVGTSTASAGNALMFGGYSASAGINFNGYSSNNDGAVWSTGDWLTFGAGWNPGTPYSSAETTTGADGRAHIIVSQLAAGGDSFYLDSASVVLRSNGAASVPAVNAVFKLGYFSGWTIGHLAMIKGTLSTAQRQQYEGYLAWKFNIQSQLLSTHPYVYSPPLLEGVFNTTPNPAQPSQFFARRRGF